MFRVAGAYLAVAFAAVEGVLTSVHFAHLPDWSFRLALGAAVLGFPVAMVLAWDYDITPSGIERTPEEPPVQPLPEPPLRRWTILVVGSLILGGVLIALR